MNKVTIHDVASLANVSPATVSRVINGKKVKKDLLEKTMYAINTLGYEMKAQKRHQRKEENLLIGVIVPDIKSPFYAETVAGILKEATSHGYEVILKDSESIQTKEREHLKTLSKLPLNALIYYPIAEISALYDFPLYQHHQIPIVIGGRENTNNDLCHVYFNNEKAGYLATKYLAKLGKNRIYYLAPVHELEKPITTYEDLITLEISPNKESYVSLRRMIGYRTALSEANIPFDSALIKPCGYTWQNGYDIARELVTSLLEVDAIIAVNDAVAAGIIKFLKEQGIRVPEDISIIGYDNRTMAKTSDPLLTTIDQDAYALGCECVTCAIAQLNGLNVSHKCLDVSLVIRHSTAATNSNLNVRIK